MPDQDNPPFVFDAAQVQKRIDEASIRAAAEAATRPIVANRFEVLAGPHGQWIITFGNSVHMATEQDAAQGGTIFTTVHGAYAIDANFAETLASRLAELIMQARHGSGTS